MQPEDLRILCTALGFTAVAVKGNPAAPDGARRALGFANLIEAFCTHTVPSLGAAANENEAWRMDETIEKLKTGLRSEGSAPLNHSRATLFHLYDRLRTRYAAFATDDMVADRVLELLDAELENEGGRTPAS